MNSSSELELIPLDTFTGIVKPGSYVASSYSSSGKKLEQGVVHGDPKKVQKMIDVMNGNAQRTGAIIKKPAPQIMPTKKAGKGAKIKLPVVLPQVIPEVQQPVVAQPTGESIDVVFLTDFGTITLSAEAILDIESAVCLVFKNEKELKFVPKTGSYLSIRIYDQEVKTYFPGIILPWMDKCKQLMLLVKTDEPES